MNLPRTKYFKSLSLALAILCTTFAASADVYYEAADDSLAVVDTIPDLTKLGIPGERHAQIGILVRDIHSGEVIVDVCAEKNLVPASVMKSLTTASALRLEDRNKRFATRYELAGHRDADSGLFRGNLVIRACGDPTLDSAEFPEYAGSIDSVVVCLQRLGITEITGGVDVRESMSGAGQIPQWEIDDVAWAYGAGLYGLNYKDNIFTLNPTTGKTEPYVPGLLLDKKVAPKGNGTDLVRGIGSNTLEVCSDKFGQKKYTVRSTMPHPARVYTYALTQAIRNAGIKISDKTVSLEADADFKTLYTHLSPTLLDILRNLMVHSNNLFAEGVLRSLAPEGSRSAAISRVVKLWRESGLESQYITMRDGSGLARVDRFSPEFISDVLQYMAQSPLADDYVSCFARVGINGTVRKLLAKTRLEGQLALKSGSMNGVLCYAGYKLGEDGRPTHTVAIMVNSYCCTSTQLRELIQDYLLKVF